MLTLTGLAAELFEEIAALPVVDAHEHLPLEAERLAREIDALYLFTHYAKADLDAAGLTQGAAQEAIQDTSRPLAERWREFKPYFEAIRFGSYARAALIYVQDVLGFDDLDDETVGPISERLQADNKPGCYDRVLRDLCGIEQVIQCVEEGREGDPPYFRHLFRSMVLNFGSGDSLTALEEGTGVSIASLRDCVEALGLHAARRKRAGAVGMKIGAAYCRTLDFPNVPAAEAEPLFCRLRSSVRARLSDREMETLENYLIRREIEACQELDLPVVIHTGYQAGNRNDIRNTRATHLWSLLRAYPRVRFDLFHGSFPYVSDMTALGKYFANVSLNMCWMHIMSPEISRRALREWLDAVPVTKIFAFGGDYRVVEKVYGHLQLARADVATVLAEKVASGWMTRAQAIDVARLLFHDNAKRWYNI